MSTGPTQREPITIPPRNFGHIEIDPFELAHPEPPDVFELTNPAPSDVVSNLDVPHLYLGLRYLGGGLLSVFGEVGCPASALPSTVTISDTRGFFDPIDVSLDANQRFQTTVSVTGKDTIVATFNGVTRPTVSDCNSPTSTELANTIIYANSYTARIDFTIISFQDIKVLKSGGGDEKIIIVKMLGLSSKFASAVLLLATSNITVPQTNKKNYEIPAAPFDPNQDPLTIGIILTWDTIIKAVDLTDLVVTCTDDLEDVVTCTFDINAKSEAINIAVLLVNES